MRTRLSTGLASGLLVCALVLAMPALAKVLKGTPGNDKLIGSKNGDRLMGRAGNDILRSAERRDVLFGGKGKDFIKAGKGFDEIHAGRGADEVHVRDGTPDQIDCGPGNDTVLVDGNEEGVFDCEKVKEPKP